MQFAQLHCDVAVPVKSVPPRGSGWVSCANAQSRPLSFRNPLPRGGTDLTGTIRWTKGKVLKLHHYPLTW